MKYTVNPWNNFCRVFELPEKFPTDYCFSGGNPVNFKLVDWFSPVNIPRAAVSKEVWAKRVGDVTEQDVEIDHETHKSFLLPFLQGKQYVKSCREYLFLSEFGMAFVFSAEEP